jgi:hypothetical protein
MRPMPVEVADREALLRAYCLGALDDRERDQVESALVADAAVLEEVDATADDLIRDYLAAQLSDEERLRFEHFFLASPRRSQRVAFVRDLMAAVERARPAAAPSRPAVWPRGLWAAAAVLAAALAVLVSLVLLRGRTSSPGVAEDPRAPSIALPPPLPPPRARIARLDLPAGAAGGPPVVVPVEGASALRLRIAVSEPIAPGYSVRVGRRGRPPVFTAVEVLPDDAQVMTFTIPLARVAAGDYDYEVVVESDVVREGPIAPRVLRYRLRLAG